MYKQKRPIMLWSLLTFAASFSVVPPVSALVLTTEDAVPTRAQHPETSTAPATGGFGQAPAENTRKHPLPAEGSVKPTGSIPQASGPDLTSATRVRINGTKSVVWNSSVLLMADQAEAKINNRCRFRFDHVIRNIGPDSAGAFITQWSDSSDGKLISRQFASVSGKASVVVSDLLDIGPGKHALTLKIDKNGQVKESNESNNTFKVIAILNGSCGQKSSEARPAITHSPHQNAPMKANTSRKLNPFNYQGQDWRNKVTTFPDSGDGDGDD